MDKMTAIARLNELRRQLSTAQQVDHLQNEGGEGFESAEAVHQVISAYLDEMQAFGLLHVNNKTHDATDWTELRTAWNAAIMANKDKGQAAMLAAAKDATGYTADQIMYLKSFFAK